MKITSSRTNVDELAGNVRKNGMKERKDELDIYRQSADLVRQAKTGRYYHNAKKLAETYRGVMWGLEHTYTEAQGICVGLGYEGILEALDYLEEGLSDELQSLRLDDSARSLLFTHSLIKLVDRAMLALKEYPGCGEAYYELIQRLYFLKYSYTEDEMLDTLGISRSTFYRKKKEALSLLGMILWGYMLPGIIAEAKSDINCETEMRPI